MFAALAMVLMCAGERERAAGALERGLSGWPESPLLLSMAIEVVEEPARRLALLERLASIEPASSSALVEETRDAVLRGAPTPFSPASIGALG